MTWTLLDNEEVVISRSARFPQYLTSSSESFENDSGTFSLAIHFYDDAIQFHDNSSSTMPEPYVNINFNLPGMALAWWFLALAVEGLAFWLLTGLFGAQCVIFAIFIPTLCLTLRDIYRYVQKLVLRFPFAVPY